MTSDLEIISEAYRRVRDLAKLRCDFQEVGDQQRGEPESLMLRFQAALHGGLHSFLAEHVGDLSHRASELYPDGRPMGYPYIVEKLDKCIRTLTREYGFEKERLENLDSNATMTYMAAHPEVIRKYEQLRKKIDKQREDGPSYDAAIRARNAYWWEICRSEGVKQTREELDKHARAIGKQYADAHRNLVRPLTTLQRMGQQAAIAVGEYRFDDCTFILQAMKRMIDRAEREGKLDELYFEGYKQSK